MAQLLPLDETLAALDRGWDVTIVYENASTKPIATVLPVVFDDPHYCAASVQREVIATARLGDTLAIQVLRAIAAFNMKEASDVQANARRKSKPK